jgi:hypothetical protein
MRERVYIGETLFEEFPNYSTGPITVSLEFAAHKGEINTGVLLFSVCYLEDATLLQDIPPLLCDSKVGFGNFNFKKEEFLFQGNTLSLPINHNN